MGGGGKIIYLCPRLIFKQFKMKKVFVLALMSPVVFSCNKEKDEENYNNSIEGTWYEVSYIEGGKTYETTECERKETITYSAGIIKFLDCNLKSKTECGECKESDTQETYTISGNKLITKGFDRGKEVQLEYTFSIEKNILTTTTGSNTRIFKRLQ